MADVDLQLTPEQIEVVETEILDFFAVTQDEVAAELGIDAAMASGARKMATGSSLRSIVGIDRPSLIAS